ncbi:(2Fe-2S) ferredoxin domain-containing protein [Mahella australiensis]|uniref:NAD(P)-dependent iron-only hydrogenase iron-sulfur protein n=1 Tax=Mahella australiensis (strain DSM 15567 / CIP 107919 / 50-1 BON) TaxID=697281 RepID=F3ZW66_MAHA5|nr:(2Fe-2S) ferredoxin domain-containing protein [Mahella australiensis]AEE96446.1 NAD(P)-dependent iron-only hydrogenase iron-sulfur protein [Mahella australiensis 50-1 BON]
MITLEELDKIREKAQEKMSLRQSQNATRVVVGMATCGIAAGARPVMLKFMEEIQKRGLTDVIVSQTGCVGVCRLEPIVDVYRPNEDKVTYVKMTPEKVSRVVAEHIVNGHPVTEYTIGYTEGQSQN